MTPQQRYYKRHRLKILAKLKTTKGRAKRAAYMRKLRKNEIYRKKDNAANLAWYYKNRSTCLAKAKKRYNRDEHTREMRKWRQQNKDRYNAYAREYRQKLSAGYIASEYFNLPIKRCSKEMLAYKRAQLVILQAIRRKQDVGGRGKADAGFT